MNKKIYEIFRRELDGGKYKHIANSQNRKAAIEQAERLALESEKRLVFCVYELDAETMKTRTAGSRKPAGNLIYENETCIAQTGESMRKEKQVTYGERI